MKSCKAFRVRVPGLCLLSLSLILPLLFGFSGHLLAKPRMEVTEKRTLNSKTFDNGDGTFTLEAHGGHIHYVDRATGELKEADTTLIDMGDKWIQSKASYRCEIPKYADRPFAFNDVFEGKNQTLMMKPLARPVLGEIDNSDGWVNKRVLYRNAFGRGRHLRITAGNVGLFKEVIIDHKPTPLRDLAFDFQVSLPSEEYVYVQDPGVPGSARKVKLASLTLTGHDQLLVGQGPIGQSDFSYIRRIRVWDSDGQAINGRLEFYSEGSNHYYRKIVPKEFLATATYPVYTDATTTFLAGTGDGWVQKKNSPNWDITHDAASGSKVDYTLGSTFLARAGITSDGDYIITRGFLPFDTSSLPDTASISAAVLDLYITGLENGDNDGDDFIVVVQAAQSSTSSLVLDDYDQCGAVNSPNEGSSRYDVTTDFVDDAYNSLILNLTGLGWISTTGWTKLGLREGHDVLDHPYVGANGTKNRIAGRFADYAGTNFDPKLAITYTEDGGPSTYHSWSGGSNTYPYDTWEKASTSIQSSIDAASTGEGIVFVRKGASSYGPIMMRNNVIVVAEDPLDPPTIHGFGAPAVTFQGPLSNATLDGIIITGGLLGGGGQVHVDGSAGAVTDVTIQNCFIDGTQITTPPGGGIVLEGAVAPTIKDCRIINSYSTPITTTLYFEVTFTGKPITIQGCELQALSPGSLGGAGIRISSNQTDAIQIIIGGDGANGNHIHDSPLAGIRLDDLGPGSEVTIDNNVIENNGSRDPNAGIYLENVSGATIKRNTIRNNGRAGIAINAASAGANLNQVMTIGGSLTDGNEIYNNQWGGINFGGRIANQIKGDFWIQGNNIYSNQRGGIFFTRKIIGKATINQNDIHDNNWGGIALKRDAEIEITRNNIRNHVNRGGIHTGEEDAFAGTLGGPLLTIRQNKVHHNQGASRGGGIDVRHASGSIDNNQIYKNARGGIRFGNYISQITNNTVVSNGQNDFGGGIVFDDPDIGAINDPPEGTLIGNPIIRNNIIAYSEQAGLRVGGGPNGDPCPDNLDFGDGGTYRDFNIVYGNYAWNDVFGRANAPDCGWPNLNDMSCTQQQYGGCGAYFDFSQSPFIVLFAPNDVMADPSFVDMANDDYQMSDPSAYPGDDFTQRGSYGGMYPIVDAEIPEF